MRQAQRDGIRQSPEHGMSQIAGDEISREVGGQSLSIQHRSYPFCKGDSPKATSGSINGPKWDIAPPS